jgi:acetyltransferase-like isoleucine patch superfamily enzyme
MENIYNIDELSNLGFKNIGLNCKIAKTVLFYYIGNISIGDNCIICDYCIISGKNEGITIGNNVHIGSYVSIYSHSKIMIGNKCYIYDHCIISSIYDKLFEYSNEDNIKSDPITIYSNVIIGPYTLIKYGVSICDNVKIESHSVIQKSISEDGINGENPSKFLKNRLQNKHVIIIPTYYRQNGKTFIYLQKSLNSIFEQTFTLWDLIIVGDKYERINELNEIIDNLKEKLINQHKNNKIILLHNDNVERDYLTDKNKLWCCAGANSLNLGLKYARENGYIYYYHLDDDDYWYPNHMEEISKIYSKYDKCIFINTKSSYGETFLPSNNIDIFENNLLPTPCGMIHSSFSFRLDIINYSYRSLSNDDIAYPSDAFMLQNIRNFLINNKNYCSIYISILTCRHDSEGESINS